MLKPITAHVLVHQSEWCQSNTIVVQGDSGVLLIDPGIHGYELGELASDLSGSGHAILAGFSTHPQPESGWLAASMLAGWEYRRMCRSSCSAGSPACRTGPPRFRGMAQP